MGMLELVVRSCLEQDGLINLTSSSLVTHINKTYICCRLMVSHKFLMFTNECSSHSNINFYVKYVCF